MIKNHWKTICHTILITLITVMVLTVCLHSGRTSAPMPTQLTFRGEYSFNGEDWMPLDKKVKLSALDGELILRGDFGAEIPEGQDILVFLDHIGCSISVNDELVVQSAAWEEELQPAACGKIWQSIISPGIAEGDVVEIHLRNGHRFGNSDAYSEFLQGMYTGEKSVLKAALEEQNEIFRLLGTLIMVLSVAVIGVALAFSAIHSPMHSQVWTLGLMSLFMGGYIGLDTVDVSLWSDFYVFNTYAQHLCMMLALFELGMFLATYLKTKAEKIVIAAMCLEGVLLAGIAVGCISGRVLIYDTLLFWGIAQMFFCPVLLVCCAYEWYQSGQKWSAMLMTCILLLITVMLDLVNSFFLWWSDGFVTKAAFAVLFVAHLIRGIRYIPAGYQKALQADALENDLKNSRIMMAMNQIRTHFIFNILNAISGMCKYDPEKADRTVVQFARYLRTNIDIMQDDQMVSFRSELRHLEDYVALEQIRFGDKIQFDTEINVEHFMVPPLILQPIVENSIKHGLTPKISGGTVMLRTWEDENWIRIEIRDDGIGFEPGAMDNSKSVGLKNVRFRLKHVTHGDLEIESIPGEGTVATISIPREEAEKCM